MSQRPLAEIITDAIRAGEPDVWSPRENSALLNGQYAFEVPARGELFDI